MKTLRTLGLAALLACAAVACAPGEEKQAEPETSVAEAPAPIDSPTPVEGPAAEPEAVAEAGTTADPEAAPAELPEVRYYVLSDA